MDRWMRDGVLKPLLNAAGVPDAPLHVVDKDLAGDAFAAWRSGTTPWSSAWALVALDQWLRMLG